MADQYVGAIDSGTTSTRFVLFDRQANVVGWEQAEHRQILPKPGWVEHDPVEIWNNTCKVIRSVLERTGINGRQIVALGISNQRETLVMWDKLTGRPYGHAIVWQCTRTDEICRNLALQGGPDRFRDRTGLPISTYFTGPKIRWMLDHVSAARLGVEKGLALAGTIESWLIWQLTGGPQGGVHVSDVTNAARTQLMNLQTLTWDDEILQVMQVPASVLPVIVPSIDPGGWGVTTRGGPLAAAVPVCAALGDQQSALVGQACFKIGEVKNTYGTGCFLLLNTGTQAVRSRHGLITTVAYQMQGRPPVYCLEGSVAVAGALVQWLRDNLGIIGQAADIEGLARSVADSGDAYIVPAFSGLFAPYWRSDARGVLVGLTRYFNKAHLARAVLEAVAYQSLDVVEAMIADGAMSIDALRVDGGMAANDLLMQIQADVLGLPVTRPAMIETTALGAAGAAGLAAGFWKDWEELRHNRRNDKSWQPQWSDSRRQAGISGWRKAVQRSFEWTD